MRTILLFSIFFLFLVFSKISFAVCDVYIDNTTIPYSIIKNNTYYCLNQSIGKAGASGINFASNIHNSTVDCQWWNINGNNYLGAAGVAMTQGSVTNNTIKNCNITNYQYGIQNLNSNNTFINNTANNALGTAGIYLSSASYNTLINNTFNSNSYGFYINAACNYTTLINNTANSNAQYGFWVYVNFNNNTLINNTFNSNKYGILIAGYNTTITGGSISSSTTSDYELAAANTTSNFTSTNFTAARKIKFDYANSWFNYANDTSSLWLRTNGLTSTIQRTLNNWSSSNISWNENTTSGTATANYTIFGLIQNANYSVYNYTTLAPVYTLNASSCGCINFTIDINTTSRTIQAGIDTTPPTYSSNSTNSTIAGTPVLHSLSWSDNAGLSGYIFSFDNCTGSLANDTWSSFSGTWSNVTKTINSTAGCTVRWCVYANDTSNIWNGTSCSSPFAYTTGIDTTPPTYSSNSTNSTIAGTPVLHSLNWTDNTALSGYIFSFDNGTGTLVNDTWRNFENQTGNVIFMDGFESGNFNLWTGQQTFTGGTVGITTSNAHNGADSTNITVPSHAGGFVQANEYKTLSATYSQLFMRQYVKWTSGGPTNAQADGIGLGELAAGKNLGDAGVIAIVYNNSGSYVWAVRYKNGTTWYTSTSSQSVQQNVWYSVEIKANDTGFTLYVDGSPIIDLAGLSITSSYNTVQTGTIYTDAGTWSWTFYTDDVVVSTFYIGPFNSWSNITKTINSTFGTTIRWCVYANDTSNNWNGTSCSSPFTYTTISSDATPPQYSSNSTNSTLAGTPVLHSLKWSDNVALSGYIFQFCNGTWNGTDCLGASLNWADSSCNYRRKLTFSQLFGTENLTNFPILVVLNSTRIDYTKTSSADIRFYDADNSTLLKKETELWNSAGNSYVWIKVPQVDNNTQDFIWAYYNCSNSNSDDATNVWNNNYIAVWHMSQSSGNIIDSTVNALNSNTPSGISYQQAGKIGKSISQGAANYIQWTDSSLFSPGSGNFTVEAWADSTTASTAWGIIWNNYGASQLALVDIAQSNDRWRSYYRNDIGDSLNSTSAGSVQSGSWQYIVGVRKGSNGYIYVDGKQDGSASSSMISITVNDGTYLPGTTDGPSVGTYGFQGYIDELRISNTSRSQSWVNASYLTESDNFITYGNEDAKSLSWVNDTWSSFSGTWSNITKTINSTTGATIAWCVYANDTSNNWNGTSCSSPFTYTTISSDATPPQYSSNSTNSTLAGTPVLHSLNWFDNVALSGYIFQFCNGTWNGSSCLIGSPASWANSSFDRCKNITITNTGSSTLVNFPAYINLSYDSDMLSDYQDLRFYDTSCNNGGSILDYEIENYTASNAHIWVRIHSLPTSGVTISVYYKNNTAVSSGQNATGVWDSNYVAVWHFNEASGSTVFDSTSNGNNGTKKAVGEPAYNSSGKIGGAQKWDGSDDYINVSDSSALNLLGNFTLEAWLYPISYGIDTDWVSSILGKIQTGSDVGWWWTTVGSADNLGGVQGQIRTMEGVQTNFQVYGNESWLVGLNRWTYTALTIQNGTTLTPNFYMNATNTGKDTTPPEPEVLNPIKDSTGRKVVIGLDPRDWTGYDFNGSIDEIRISNTTRSADWINQTYQMVQNQNTYVSFGGVTNKPSVGGWVNDTWSSFSGTWSNVTKTINSTTGATIAWCVYANDTSNNWNGTSCSSPFTYTTTGTTFISISISPALTNGIMFGTINPSTNDNPALNNTNGAGGGTAYNITIDSSTTVNVDLYNGASGNLISGSYLIGIGNVTNQANTTSNTGNNLVATGSIALSTVYSIIGSVCQNLLANSNCWISYWLDSPTTQPPGSYTTTYKYCAVQNGAGYSQCG